MMKNYKDYWNDVGLLSDGKMNHNLNNGSTFLMPFLQRHLQAKKANNSRSFKGVTAKQRMMESLFKKAFCKLLELYQHVETFHSIGYIRVLAMWTYDLIWWSEISLISNIDTASLANEMIN